MTTIQNIKKALEICSKDDDCRKCPYYDYHRCDRALPKDVLALINEQEKSIQVAQQNQKYQEQRIKQAKIDVLNELKVRHDYANIAMGYPWWDVSQQIDELITEVQNE